MKQKSIAEKLERATDGEARSCTPFNTTSLSLDERKFFTEIIRRRHLESAEGQRIEKVKARLLHEWDR